MEQEEEIILIAPITEEQAPANSKEMDFLTQESEVCPQVLYQVIYKFNLIL